MCDSGRVVAPCAARNRARQVRGVSDGPPRQRSGAPPSHLQPVEQGPAFGLARKGLPHGRSRQSSEGPQRSGGPAKRVDGRDRPCVVNALRAQRGPYPGLIPSPRPPASTHSRCFRENPNSAHRFCGRAEFLDLWSTNGILPSFGLNVDDIQSETIFLDDAVDAFVSRLPNRLPCLLPRTSVAHVDQHIYDKIAALFRRRPNQSLRRRRGRIQFDPSTCVVVMRKRRRGPVSDGGTCAVSDRCGYPLVLARFVEGLSTHQSAGCPWRLEGRQSRTACRQALSMSRRRAPHAASPLRRG